MRAGFAIVLLLGGCYDLAALTIRSTGDAAAGDASSDAAAAVDGTEPAIDLLAPDLPSHCSSGVRDGDETDVDCGGRCRACEPDRLCVRGTDCATFSCVDGRCALATSPPSWLGVKDCPAPVVGAAAAGGPGDRLYLLGGAVGGQVLPSVSAYDPVANEWRDGLAAMPRPRQDHAAAVAADGKKIYVVGGVGGSSGSSEVIVTAVDVFDGAAWSTLAGVKARVRTAHGLAALGDALVVAGGLVEGKDSRSVERLALAGGAQWERWPDLGGERSALGMAATVDQLIVVGGVRGASEVATVEAIKATEKSWAAQRELPQPRAALGVVLGADGRVYAVGGRQGGKPRAEAWAFSPPANLWTRVAPLGAARAGHAVARGPDGRIYAIGGASGCSVEAYGPSATVTPHTAPPGSAVVVDGTNFAADARITVWLGDPAGAVLGVGVTDGKGKLIKPIALAAPASAGEATLVVADHLSRYPVRLRLTVR